MKTYSMAQVASLTGINPHTLRKWESRYSFIHPLRTETNIRYYSETQLKMLLNISLLTQDGMKVSDVDQLTTEQIHAKVKALVGIGNVQAEIKSLVTSMLSLDEVAFNHVIQQESLRHGLLDTIQDLIYPFLAQVGILWGTNEAIPAQEHFISNLIRQKLFAAIDQLPTPLANAKRIVLFLPEGEQHEIGLLLASFIAREMGWKVYYLGQNVPFVNLKEINELVKPQLMMTLVITPMTPEYLQQFNLFLTDTTCPIVYSGTALALNESDCKSTITYLEQPTDLVEFLTTLNTPK